MGDSGHHISLNGSQFSAAASVECARWSSAEAGEWLICRTTSLICYISARQWVVFERTYT